MVDVTGSTIGDYHNYYSPKTYILYYPGDLENLPSAKITQDYLLPIV